MDSGILYKECYVLIKMYDSRQEQRKAFISSSAHQELKRWYSTVIEASVTGSVSNEAQSLNYLYYLNVSHYVVLCYQPVFT